MPRYPCTHHCNPCKKLSARHSRDGFCYKHQWVCHSDAHKVWVVGNNQACDQCGAERNEKTYIDYKDGEEKQIPSLGGNRRASSNGGPQLLPKKFKLPVEELPKKDDRREELPKKFYKIGGKPEKKYNKKGGSSASELLDKRSGKDVG